MKKILFVIISIVFVVLRIIASLLWVLTVMILGISEMLRLWVMHLFIATMTKHDFMELWNNIAESFLNVFDMKLFYMPSSKHCE